MDLKNMRVLITGGGSGIGEALAKTFSRQNARVAICGRHLETLEKVQDKTPGLLVYKADITITDDIVSLKAKLDRDMNGIDILVNNAGRIVRFDITDGILNSSKNEIELNFIAVLNLIDHFLPELLNRRQSAVINISSGYALAPVKSAPVYCATKAAVHSFTKSLRWQLKNTPVKVIEVLPPLVATPGATVKGGMDPIVFSERVIRQVINDKLEIKIGQVMLLAIMMHLAPWLVDDFLKNR